MRNREAGNARNIGSATRCGWPGRYRLRMDVASKALVVWPYRGAYLLATAHFLDCPPYGVFGLSTYGTAGWFGRRLPRGQDKPCRAFRCWVIGCNSRWGFSPVVSFVAVILIIGFAVVAVGWAIGRDV